MEYEINAGTVYDRLDCAFNKLNKPFVYLMFPSSGFGLRVTSDGFLQAVGANIGRRGLLQGLLRDQFMYAGDGRFRYGLTVKSLPEMCDRIAKVLNHIPDSALSIG